MMIGHEAAAYEIMPRIMHAAGDGDGGRGGSLYNRKPLRQSARPF